MDSKLILEAARGTLDGTVRAGMATGSSASVAVCKDRRAWNIITMSAKALCGRMVHSWENGTCEPDEHQQQILSNLLAFETGVNRKPSASASKSPASL